MTQRYYGWKPQLPDFRDWKWKVGAPVAAMPIDLRPSCPTVYDQGDLGSCTANMGAGALEFDMMRQGISPIFTPSRLGLYWCERLDDGTTAIDAGSSIREAYKAMNTYGIAPETEWPYDISQFAVKPPDSYFADALKDRVVKYEAVDQSLDGIRSVLQSGFPVGYGFTVYESFESDAVAANGIVPMPGSNEGVLGGHATLLVGDMPDENRFITRNSWGPNWGASGYFYMPYDYLLNPDLASDFWVAQLVSA